MNNIFKYIKVTDINPNFKFYHSDSETDAEEQRLSSDDDIPDTDTEDSYKYDEIRKQYLISEMKLKRIIKEKEKLNDILTEQENIIFTIKNNSDDLENEINELVEENFNLKQKKINDNNNKIAIFSTISCVTGLMIGLFINKNSKKNK